MHDSRTRSVVRMVAAAAACACAQVSNGAPPPVTGSAGNSATGAFAAALEPRTFEFPRDHGPHPAFRQEWWYFTGNLAAMDGQRFGFELTFFRVALVPSADGPVEASAWRTREIYVAHFAITDVARKRFRFQQKLSRAALGLAGAQSGPLHVWLDDWSLEESAADNSGHWKLHAAQPGYAIDLALEPQSAPVLNGEAGLSRKSEQAQDATYYYSVPRLAVTGRLVRDGEPVELHGLAWLDREWGSGGLGPRQAGWDWFGLQLDDGSALMFYALRDKDGARDGHSAGTFIAADGTTRALASTDVSIAVGGSWRNRSGERYPAGWRIRVPALALDLAVHPVLADQELRTTPPYWEGAVDVSGDRSGEILRGRGYVELVGYAQER
ncbi:MAG TPA: lipocalin-like domain-containing protein [Steroidobacteraceae bacterium]|nr:lipocalin-like domain-containing protein [Steroidobacteraceae bacterium]